jgi:hypothetical protein
MAFAKWAIVFAAAFCLAFVIIVTFSQAPFKQAVPAMIFSYQTRAIPLYWYVVGALGAGLAVGLAVALYNYIDLQAANFRKNKTIRELEERIAVLQGPGREAQVRAAEPAAPVVPEPGPVDKIVDKIDDEDI